MKMAGIKMIDVYWSPKVNMARMYCPRCFVQWEHRLDRWRVVCPKCGRVASIEKLRNEFVLNRKEV